MSSLRGSRGAARRTCEAKDFGPYGPLRGDLLRAISTRIDFERLEVEDATLSMLVEMAGLYERRGEWEIKKPAVRGSGG